MAEKGGGPRRSSLCLRARRRVAAAPRCRATQVSDGLLRWSVAPRLTVLVLYSHHDPIEGTRLREAL